MQTTALGLELRIFDIKQECAGSSFMHNVIPEQTFLIDFHFRSRWAWTHFLLCSGSRLPVPFGALVSFLGRPLNDHCLALTQIQPSHSLHWTYLNRCPVSSEHPFCPHLPALNSRQHSTVQANVCDCKTILIYSLSWLFFSSRGEGWIWNNKVRCPVARVNTVGGGV